MNRENLYRMAEFIKTVPQDKFVMSSYRLNNGVSEVVSTPKCNTVGCIIGHCTVLDNKKNIPMESTDAIDFSKWSEQFTGLKSYSYEWKYLFSSDWKYVDNTPLGASKRILYFLEYGLPNDWHAQMNNLSKLSYNK